MKCITSHNRNTHFKPFVASTWQPATHAVDFCADSRRAGKLALASVVEMERESGGAQENKENTCVNLTTAGRKN